jgi:AcrR family transcriptional regulator
VPPDTEPPGRPAPEQHADQRPGQRLGEGAGGAPDRPQPPVRGERLARIVAAARAVLAAEGIDALTMRRLASELDIQAPSLYKHLSGKPAVEDALIVDALTEIGTALHQAVAAAPAGRAVVALLHRYRSVGRREPNLYRLATGRPLRRDSLPAGLEAWAGEPFYLVTGDEPLAQALWSYAHGMVVLELDGRYPPGSDLDATWRAGAEAFQAAADRTRGAGRAGG